MSLIPYHPQEGREIVLRHRNAIVVRDPTSRRLEIRGLSECPTCHRPLHDDGLNLGNNGSTSSTGRPDPGHARHDDYVDDYVDPNYFRMLQAGYRVGQLRAASGVHGHDEHDHDGHSGNGPTSPGQAPTPTPPATSALRRLLRPLGSSSGSRQTDSSSRPVTPPPTKGRITDWEGSPGSPGSLGSPGSPGSATVEEVIEDHTTTEILPETPPPDCRRSSIRKEAFSPNYFATFFVEERELGRGGKGVVLLVRHEIDGLALGHFACKRVPVGDDHAWLEKVLVEVEVLARLSHPNLVSYRHVWLENVRLGRRFGGVGGEGADAPVACAFILQQYCNGGDLQRYVVGEAPVTTKEDLKERVRRRRRSRGVSPDKDERGGGGRPPLPPDEIYSLFRDITSGLAYLHAAHYIHRDLKPSNCLLHREGRTLTCLISDFGEVQPSHTVRRSTGTTGTLSYCAPEVLESDEHGQYGNFTTKSDVFSLGMILYFMCFGRLPYRAANALHEELEDMTALRAEIIGWRGFSRARISSSSSSLFTPSRADLPPKLYALLTRMLARDPAARPSASEVLLAMRADGGLDYDGGGGGGPVAVTAVAVADETAVTDVTDSEDVLSSSGSGPVWRRKHRQRQRQRQRQEEQQPLPPLSSTSLTWARGSTSTSLAVSPERGLGLGRGGNGTTTSTSTGLAQHRRQSSASPLRRRRPSQVVGVVDPVAPTTEDAPPTPLLMPPPTTVLGAARHRARVAQHQARRWVQRHADALSVALRTLLFLVKMLSLAQPCWPYTARAGVGASLVVVAGLDLGVPARGSRDREAAAASVARIMLWEGHGHGHGHRHGHGHGHGHGNGPVPWWDWRVSVLLFVLHFVVVGVAERAEVLCTGGRDVWEGW